MKNVEFLEKYIPLLKGIYDDKEKRAWCLGYNVYQKVPGDKWGLEKDLSIFMKTAYEVGFVPSDYGHIYESIHDDSLYYEKATPEVLHRLSEKQIISIIAKEFREDHFNEGCLIYRYVAEGIMLYYMNELQRRYKKENKCVGKIREFKSNVSKELGYYVYVYSDPDTKKPFYIGKGQGNRCFAHLYEESDKEKVQKINEIKQRGKEPIIEIFGSWNRRGNGF